MEHQGVAASSSLKTLHPFINQEGFPTGGRRLQQYTSSTSNPSDGFYQIITLQNWLTQQNTRSFIMLGHKFSQQHNERTIGYQESSTW